MVSSKPLMVLKRRQSSSRQFYEVSASKLPDLLQENLVGTQTLVENKIIAVCEILVLSMVLVVK